MAPGICVSESVNEGVKSENLCDLWLDNDFLHMMPDTQPIKEKNFFDVYFLRERERVQVGEGQRERETQNQKQDPGSELSAQHSRTPFSSCVTSGNLLTLSLSQLPQM